MSTKNRPNAQMWLGKGKLANFDPVSNPVMYFLQLNKLITTWY
jgi:hypothetical protein